MTIHSISQLSEEELIALDLALGDVSFYSDEVPKSERGVIITDGTRLSSYRFVDIILTLKHFNYDPAPSTLENVLSVDQDSYFSFMLTLLSLLFYHLRNALFDSQTIWKSKLLSFDGVHFMLCMIPSEAVSDVWTPGLIERIMLPQIFEIFSNYNFKVKYEGHDNRTTFDTEGREQAGGDIYEFIISIPAQCGVMVR